MEGEKALLAHLYRRAGFGSTIAELNFGAQKGYESVVDDLLNPERFPEVDDDLLGRYNLGLLMDSSISGESERWIYRMVNTKRPLQEKIALFWHHVFATAWYKTEQNPDIVRQICMFRESGLMSFKSILLKLSRDPAMLDWLDNQENHKGEPNENYARELLELFSMGVGNYSESDIKSAALAFSGWSFIQPIPGYPYGQYPSEFVYLDDDHDRSEKTFLGKVGKFDGEDIIDIIVKQPATARFISRHLYNFFVADESPVPTWGHIGPSNPRAIDELSHAYFEHNGDIRSILRVLFNSDFFKNSLFKRVKCPAELVAGTIKLAGTHNFPVPSLSNLPQVLTMMGQELLNPPTVEGWHTGREWIDGGTLTERIDFSIGEIADVSNPGIIEITSILNKELKSWTSEDLVDSCLDKVGSMEVSGQTRSALVRHVNRAWPGKDGIHRGRITELMVVELLKLIVSSREYQFA